MVSALAVILSAGLFTAAALAPAPTTVLPLLLVVCIGGPMLAAWEMRPTIRALRQSRRVLDARALAQLRRGLDKLPETKHPLGF